MKVEPPGVHTYYDRPYKARELPNQKFGPCSLTQAFTDETGSWKMLTVTAKPVYDVLDRFEVPA
jgi:hypothetical protein